MMDNGMDSRANGNEYVDRKVRAGLYAIGLCKTARNVAEQQKRSATFCVVSHKAIAYKPAHTYPKAF